MLKLNIKVELPLKSGFELGQNQSHMNKRVEKEA